MSDVKRPNKRAQKAKETRRRILAAALELFVRDGYGATNLQDVADKAEVAVQTIYFVFGNKRALLKELVDVTIAGDDEPVAMMDRPWYTAALAAGTARTCCAPMSPARPRSWNASRRSARSWRRRSRATRRSPRCGRTTSIPGTLSS
uniref:TetR/AcrR family transcriptional regulator n=1 Tax=Microtetraspora fusca TaxID=1997 RepID=UPI001C3F2E52